MDYRKPGGAFKQKPRSKLTLRPAFWILSLISLIGGGGIFFYLQTGKAETSKAAESEILVISHQESETTFRIEHPLHNHSAERYVNDQAKTNEPLVLVRRSR